MTEPHPSENYAMPPRPKYAARTDANQADLCRNLEGLGLGFETFPSISRLADADCPGDVLVYGWHCRLNANVWQPFEVKTEVGALTEGQIERRDKVPVARCIEDILVWYGYEEVQRED